MARPRPTKGHASPSAGRWRLLRDGLALWTGSRTSGPVPLGAIPSYARSPRDSRRGSWSDRSVVGTAPFNRLRCKAAFPRRGSRTLPPCPRYAEVAAVARPSVGCPRSAGRAARPQARGRPPRCWSAQHERGDRLVGGGWCAGCPGLSLLAVASLGTEEGPASLRSPPRRRRPDRRPTGRAHQPTGQNRRPGWMTSVARSQTSTGPIASEWEQGPGVSAGRRPVALQLPHRGAPPSAGRPPLTVQGHCEVGNDALTCKRAC